MKHEPNIFSLTRICVAMVRKRSAAHVSSAQTGKRPRGTRHLQEQPALSRQHSAIPDQRGMKRPAKALDQSPEPPQERPPISFGRAAAEDAIGKPATDGGSPDDPIDSSPATEALSRRHPPAENTLGESATGIGAAQHATDPIAFWVEEGHWPKRFSKSHPIMDRLLPRKRGFTSPSSKRSFSAASTPSDQKPREQKSMQYRDARYELLLKTKGTYMDTSELDITVTSKRLVQDLLSGEQPAPTETIFDNTIFVDACRNLQGKNEPRIIQDISRLIVPSAETLALRARHLRLLAESVNQGWNNSIPLTGTRPQPDYSVGFRREAFTDDQLAKLSPFIGDLFVGDQSLFMATYDMYFPFLTCEVKCGAAGIDVADRQNAHSTTLAVRAVAELFRAVKREGEIHRQILAFSISHDHRLVRIYGYYPVVEGKDIKYYRHPISTFDFTVQDGKEKWTAYRFTKNVYEVWMPAHFKNICSAIDQLPSNLNLDLDTGPCQDLENRHVSQSNASASVPVEQNDRSSEAN